MISDKVTNLAGVYVHFPYCKSKCAYCAFVSSPDCTTQEAYLSALKREISLRGEKVPVDTIYFGGGTPSVMPSGFLSEVYYEIKKAFTVDRLTEFTVECNPDSVTESFLSECKSIGVTRLSLGLQSANDEVLKNIGRVHSVEKFISAIKLIKENTDCRVSSDLIIGLPGEKEDDALKAIDLFCDLGIEHLSLYSLSVEEGTPLFESGYRPNDDEQADEYEKAVLYLKEKGYDRYEVSNFAKNGKVALHNCKYWTGADYYGFGVSAHSLVNGVRYENESDIDKYLTGATLKSKTELTLLDKVEELVMLSLRTEDGLSLSKYETLSGKSILTEKKKEIEKLLSFGLIEISEDKLKVTDKGIYLLNSVTSELI